MANTSFKINGSPTDMQADTPARQGFIHLIRGSPSSPHSFQSRWCSLTHSLHRLLTNACSTLRNTSCKTSCHKRLYLGLSHGQNVCMGMFQTHFSIEFWAIFVPYHPLLMMMTITVNIHWALMVSLVLYYVIDT